MATETASGAAKLIIVALPGTEGKHEYRDVQILPGTRPRDVLARLNLTGFVLAKAGGAGNFAMNDDLYPAVEPGQKLFATKADVEAGNG